MATLWFDLEGDEFEEEEEKEKEPLLSEDENCNDYFDDLADLKDEEDVYCKQCGTLIEDGVQCPVCGWMVEEI